MKTNYYLLLIISFLLVLNIYQYKDEPTKDEPTIVWNDDLEGIPADGSKIVIEQTINDTIYIGNIN